MTVEASPEGQLSGSLHTKTCASKTNTKNYPEFNME